MNDAVVQANRPAGAHDTLHDAQAPALEVGGVVVRYGAASVLEDISFTLAAGERVALVGPNGAGKSTLFQVISGLVEPLKGNLLVFGHKPGRHICIAYVPQRPEIDWAFPVSVFDVVLMGRTARLGLWKHAGAVDRALAKECLEMVGLGGLAGRQIGELSGGQQQRMFIARALAQEAELMLLDEPLTGLDSASQDEFFRLLDRLRERRVTVMMATHDLNTAAARFDRVLLLNRRLAAQGVPAEVLTPEHLVSAYGAHLKVVRTEAGAILFSDTCCGGGHGE